MIAVLISLLCGQQPVAQTQSDTLSNSFFPDSSKTSAPSQNTTGNFISHGNTDSLRNFIRSDSSERRKAFRKLIPSTYGNVSAGYEYGVVPFAQNQTSPIGYYSTQGTLGVKALGLPLTANFYYSSLKNISGLNNYFRVSFDPQKYKEDLQQNSLKRLENEKRKLTELTNAQQTLQQKITYQEILLKNYPAKEFLTAQIQKYINRSNSYKSNLNADSLSNLAADKKNTLTDSVPQINKPQYTLSNPYADSVKWLKEKLQKYDSITGTLKKYKDAYENVKKQEHAIRNKIAFLEDPQQALKDNNPFLNKVETFLSGVKSLDIGLCYPNYSTFLVNGSTIKGINVEWEKKFYFAFTYGKTINTLLTTNNLIQNQLQTGRNLYNFFDFNNVKDTRKILALKFGIGKKESNHLHLGFLYGYGLSSYLNPALSGTEKNFVFELDGKYFLNRSNSLDLVYGKSALYQTGAADAGDDSPGRYLFTNFRSNAALARFTSDLTKSRTKVILTGRLVDPFFKSYGVGFIRSNNLRFEARIEQAISNKIKISGFYRRDADNLLNTYLYTTNLQTAGVNLSMKVNRRLTARAIYSPVIQNIISRDTGSYNSHKINNISTAVISYTPRLGNASSLFSAMYSYYQLSASGHSNYQSCMITNSTTSGSFKTDLAANYFYNSAGDSLNKAVLFVANLSYIRGRASVTAGVKYAKNPVLKNQFGGLLKLSLPLVRHINFDLQAERLVLGDFYNSFNLSQIRQFPYNISGKLIVTW